VCKIWIKASAYAASRTIRERTLTAADGMITDLQALHTFANTFDDTSDFRARRKLTLGLELVFSLDNEKIGEVDCCRLDIQNHLALLGLEARQVLDGQNTLFKRRRGQELRTNHSTICSGA
jgi:hypothetical protein